MKRLFFIFYCLLYCCGLWAQSNIATLTAKLKHTASDSGKVGIYLELIRHYSRDNADSVAYYAAQGLEYCKNRNYRLGEGEIISQLAIVDQNQGRMDISKQR